MMPGEGPGGTARVEERPHVSRLVHAGNQSGPSAADVRLGPGGSHRLPGVPPWEMAGVADRTKHRHRGATQRREGLKVIGKRHVGMICFRGIPQSRAKQAGRMVTVRCRARVWPAIWSPWAGRLGPVTRSDEPNARAGLLQFPDVLFDMSRRWERNKIPGAHTRPRRGRPVRELASPTTWSTRRLRWWDSEFPPVTTATRNTSSHPCRPRYTSAIVRSVLRK